MRSPADPANGRWVRHWGMPILAAATALAVVWLRLGSLDRFVATFQADPVAGWLADFDLHYMPAAHALASGQPADSMFFYSPLALLLFSGLARLPADLGRVVWLAVLLASVAALAFAGFRRLHDASPTTRAIFAVALVLSVPIHHAIRWGQISLPLAALTVWSFELTASSPRCAAALLALASATKYYPIVFALPGVAIAARRYAWNLAGWLIAFAVILPGAILGPAQTGRLYSTSYRNLGEASGWMLADPDAQYGPLVIARLASVPLRAAAVVIALVGLALIARASLLARSRRYSVADAASISVLTTPLIVAPSWPHYFVFLPWVHAQLLGRISERGSGRTGIAVIGAAMSILCSTVVFLEGSGSWLAYTHVGVLFWADVLALLATIDFARYRARVGDARNG
jgi:Glycosyltransferase family 87